MFLSLKINLVLANSADSDEMPRGISSGSSVFTIVLILGVSSPQRINSKVMLLELWRSVTSCSKEFILPN